MTPDELDRIENRVADALGTAGTIELRECGRALSKALRTAWAERDAERADALRHAEALEIVGRERDALKERPRLATQRIIEAIGSNGPENLEDALGRLLAERDARPSPEVVAKVREALEHVVGLLESSRNAKSKGSNEYDGLFIRCELGDELNEALRLLEKP